MVFKFFRKISNPVGVVIITAVTILAFWLVDIHGVPGVPRSHVLSDVGILDTAINYSPADAYDRIAAYGEQGRYAYLVFLERVDFLVPLIYGFFLVMTTVFGLSRIFPGKPELQKLCLLPLCATFFDYSENVCFLIMLKSYPNRLDAIARVANVFTLAKWGFALISILLLLITLIGFFVTKLFRRGINQRN